MKNHLNEINEILSEFADRFGIIILATLISMIARSIYKGTSIRRLLLKIPISAVIGIVVGILLQEYTEASTNSIIVLCSIMGAYTGEVLDGIEQLVTWIPKAIKKIISKKLNIDDHEK